MSARASRSWSRLVIAALAVGLGVARPAFAYDIGPPTGAHIPAFYARDAGGAPRTLASVAGPKGVVLVFFRSAKWCPFCQAQLLQLEAAVAPLAQRGYKLAAISYDPPPVLAAFAAKRAVNYTLLSDAGSRTIDAFHLRDPQYAGNPVADGVPEPGIFVIDTHGVIRAKLAEKGYRTRPSTEAVLATVDSLTK